jgi:REP element-mobilizing transposase RayT
VSDGPAGADLAFQVCASFANSAFCDSSSALSSLWRLCAARSKFSFLLVGWVLMPEHFHLLFQPWPAVATPEMKEFRQRSARSFSMVNRQS